MRTMLKVNMATEAANELARQGRLGTLIKSILDDLKPEAAYFADDNGERTGFIFFDLADSSLIPAIAEPWFLTLNAKVSFRPVMNSDDLAKAVPNIERAVKKYAAHAGSAADCHHAGRAARANRRLRPHYLSQSEAASHGQAGRAALVSTFAAAHFELEGI
jgi:hypothetical protein